MTMKRTDELRTALWAQHLRRRPPSIGFLETARTLLYDNAQAAQRLWVLPIGELQEGTIADIIAIPYLPHTPLPDENADGHILMQ